MIPFASQRGLGQDLATHLLNERDNEHMEVWQVRGAVAQDLHGAFAEWELQADVLTRCTNYLYSLSINPDERQGILTREQYLDYIERAEERLGLTGQPRAVVFHVKHDRAHCHVVWSRIDAEAGKAIHMAFDRDKLMMVTREFARAHGLELPDGYSRGRDRERKPRQLTLYEQYQQVTTGLTREERIERITDVWRRSDSAKAFVQGLAELGYTLATGRRDYVLVDYYGHTNSLPKMIGDKQVRTRDVRAFLSGAYPPDSLPSVEDAKRLAADHRKSMESFLRSQALEEKKVVLKRRQEKRRRSVEQKQAAMIKRHKAERVQLLDRQAGERKAMRAAFLAERRRIRIERARRRPTGLAAFLGRVTGVELVMKKLHKHQDKKRHQAHLEARRGLERRQEAERAEQVYRHRMQDRDIQRRVRALNQIDRREMKSLETELIREQRERARDGRSHMPAMGLDPNAPDRAQNRGKGTGRDGGGEVRPDYPEQPVTPTPEFELTDDFARAAGNDDDDDGGGDGDDGPHPDDERKIRRTRRKKNDKDFGHGL